MCVLGLSFGCYPGRSTVWVKYGCRGNFELREFNRNSRLRCGTWNAKNGQNCSVLAQSCPPFEPNCSFANVLRQQDDATSLLNGTCMGEWHLHEQRDPFERARTHVLSVELCGL